MKRGKNVDLHLRVPPDLAEWLMSHAVENERSLQGQIVFLLKQAKARVGIPARW